MKNLFCSLILGMVAMCGHAQRHDLYLGYNIASLMDGSGLRYSRIGTSYSPPLQSNFVSQIEIIPLIGYGYHFKAGWKIGLDYRRYARTYLPHSKWTSNDSTLIGRGFSMLSFSIQKPYAIFHCTVLPKASYVYRFDGFRYFFLYSLASQGRPEVFFDTYSYKHHGLSAGVRLQHKIYNSFYGGIDTSYTHFIASLDKNLFMISFLLGFSFGEKGVP